MATTTPGGALCSVVLMTMCSPGLLVSTCVKLANLLRTCQQWINGPRLLQAPHTHSSRLGLISAWLCFSYDVHLPLPADASGKRGASSTVA
ncbi:hypothetical protein AALO_G00074910 [Alosa alosa]|uniref:Secreted protein n=1 Tax=Alosa alosa TaxID=278164 RepID=A0AAV6GWA4_9TELE|nr:hypothetical protein AALO_G00074910 [Alosa alosa]